MVSRLVRFSERVMPLEEALAGEITDESLEAERIEN